MSELRPNEIFDRKPNPQISDSLYEFVGDDVEPLPYSREDVEQLVETASYSLDNIDRREVAETVREALKPFLDPKVSK